MLQLQFSDGVAVVVGPSLGGGGGRFSATAKLT